MTKNTLIILLFIGCLALVFRIFDLGVTLTYLENDLANAQSNTHTVSEFQRSDCSSTRGKIDGVSIFKKTNQIVINGLEFECKASKNSGEELLYLVEK